MMQPEYKKLCVDPQITSFEILRSLLTKAFKIRSDFSISYLTKDSTGEELYVSMLSDWDLDAAFFGASDPQLRLKVDLKPFEEGLDDWDIVAQDQNSKLSRPLNSNIREAGSLIGATLGSITIHVNKTVSQVSKAMGFKTEEPDPYKPSKPPMSDKEFHNFMDNVGHMVIPQQFRLSVYQGGVEHSLRKVIWRHLLNVFPEGMTGKERFDYLKKKTSEYYKLRDEWRTMFLQGLESEDIKFVTNMVKKDVLRTDRSHSFFAGSDESQNVVSLFNLLVTYALAHPEISYCQGMSDLASPILVVQNDEAHAYICFCGLMKRLRPFFAIDGKAMIVRFQHLNLLLQHHDSEFFSYLKQHKADDLFFCYRWLLLELKREFPFNDALRMLEVMWSSLLPDPPTVEIELADPMYYSQGFGRVPASPTFATNAYLRLKSMRQHSDSGESGEPARKKESLAKPPDKVLTPCDDMSQFDPKDFEQVTVPQTHDLKEDSHNIELSLGHQVAVGATSMLCPPKLYSQGMACGVSCDKYNVDIPVSNATVQDIKNDETAVISKENMTEMIENHFSEDSDKMNIRRDISKSQTPSISIPKSGTCGDTTGSPGSFGSPKRPSDLSVSPSFGDELPDKLYKTDEKAAPATTSSVLVVNQNGITEKTMEVSSCEEALDVTGSPSIEFINVDQKLPPLPPPQEFGHANPFLMFLCFSLFSQHRDHIVHNRMDYNDLAMHYDKMVRRHNVNRVLHQAQSLYASYLKQQASKELEEAGDEIISV